MNNEGLDHLARLIRQKNQVENEIASILQRPVQIGHAGEYIAAKILNIQLMESATHKAIDGHFRSGPLAGKSVNIKWYGKQEGILDITPAALPDFYLVMTGPKSAPAASRGGTRPWSIDHVYLFLAGELVASLEQRTSKIGFATSVPKRYWDLAEIYPGASSAYLHLTEVQMQQLAWFKED